MPPILGPNVHAIIACVHVEDLFLLVCIFFNDPVSHPTPRRGVNLLSNDYHF